MDNKDIETRHDGALLLKPQKLYQHCAIAWVEIPDAAVISGAGNQMNHLPEQEHL
jgi:hypothetical protein